MNRKELINLENTLKECDYLQEVDYFTFKEQGRSALRGEGLLKAKMDIPTLIAVKECREALNLSTQEMSDLLTYKRALVRGKNGLRSNLLRNAISKEKKGAKVFYGSTALLALMEEKGLDANGYFVCDIPVYKSVLEDVEKESFFENPLNEKCYKAILRNARRRSILEKTDLALIRVVESQLLEKAVRDYYLHIENEK